MQRPIRSTSDPQKRQTVPWWLQQKQLSLDFDAPEPGAPEPGAPEPRAPERAADDPPSEPDRSHPTGCPDALPEGIRAVYIRVFGLPALHPESNAGAACEAAVRRPVDSDARCGEVAT